MEKEQIINALECCDGTLAGCEECPNYNNRYRCKIKQDALALIKELTEENERLTKQIEMSEAAYQGLQFALSICANQVKADTVREFAEKLEITLMSRLVTATKEQKAAILFCINQINQTKAIMTKPKDCLQCKHFVGCEPSTLGGCDLYEEEEKK